MKDKKHPIKKSVWQILLLIVFLAGVLVIIDCIDENGYVSQDLVFNRLLVVIGFIGSALILFINIKGKCKNLFRFFVPSSLVLLIVVGLSIYSHELKLEEVRKTMICGSAGDLYFCESEEPITCDNSNYAVRDSNAAGYKCVGYNEYRHDYLGEEYDYPCIGKYEKEDKQPNEVTALMWEEKACYEPKIEALAKQAVESKKKDNENKGIESKFDIRDKVKVLASDQGTSDTCEIWSSTKALEISAQLKGLDYQFLLDFEKKINDLDANIDGIITDDYTIILGSDHLIPGKKKYYYFSSDSEIGEDYVNIDISSYQNSMLYNNYNKILSQVYFDKSGYDIYDEINSLEEYDRELLKLYTKELIKNNGSAFIKFRHDIQPGHRMLIIGWDDSKESWLVLNSWGNSWPPNKYVPSSNGDGTIWIKYSNKNYVVGSANIGGNAIELMGQ